MKILTVEDDYISRNVLQRTLQIAGYDTVAAEDGLEALEKYNEGARKIKKLIKVLKDFAHPGEDKPKGRYTHE